MILHLRYLPIIILVSSIILLSACSEPKKPAIDVGGKENFRFFSKNVKDSFSISIQLPLEYLEYPEMKYPVVVVTDANFYFPMLGPVMHQYQKGGLLPPLILVGVGYKSLMEMDSLRVRDFMYPAALPSDEMKASGGGLNFYRFITKEILPKIHASYRTEKGKSTLLGHSFGGYFSMLALLQQTEEQTSYFQGFVSASPSLWYNDFYLKQLPEKLQQMRKKDTLNILLTVGEAEEYKWSVKPVKEFSKQFDTLKLDKVKKNTEIYSHIDHMDVGLISFTKGLQRFYNEPEVKE